MDNTPLPYTFQPRRPLGRTGFPVTRIGIGDVADRTVPLDQCVATVCRALAAGLNLVDTAPSYEDGYSEQIVGRAVAAVDRGRVFVIDKVDHLDQPVGPQVDASLARLGLAFTDAFVFHGVSKLDDWQRLVGPGGGLDQLAACQRAGRTRFLGISSHHPDVLLAAIQSGRCDLVMFPVGPFADPRYARQVLPLARERNVGTVCFKTFGAGKLVADTEGYGRPLQPRPRGKFSSGPGGSSSSLSPSGRGQGEGGSNQLPLSSWERGRGEGAQDAPGSAGAASAGSVLPKMPVADCVRYTLTCDPDVALLGMSFPAEQDAALSAAAEFTAPLSPARLAELEAQAAECIRDKGRIWWNPGE